MTDKASTISPIWEKHPKVFSNEQKEINTPEITKLISEILMVGEFYYYIIDIQTAHLSQQHPNLIAFHGLTEQPNNLQQIIDLVHPEDIKYVLLAEDYCHKKIIELGKEFIPYLKSSYCFRMLMANGSYQMIHHQSITIVSDHQNRVIKSLNIHTNINHITTKNSYIAYITGILGRTDFHEMNLAFQVNTSSSNISASSNHCNLTKREKIILSYIAQGYSSGQISRELEISELTVRVHRKNILKKTKANNSSSLIRIALELGLL